MSTMDLSVVIEAIDKFSAPARKIASLSDGMAQSFDKTYQSAKGLSDQVGQLGKFKMLKKDFAITSKAFSEAQQQVNALAKEMRATTKPSKQLRAEFERAKRQAASLKAKHGEQREALHRLRTALGDAGVNTREFGSAQARLHEKLQSTNRQMERMASLGAKVEQAQANYDRALQRAANVSLIAGGLERVGRGMTDALRQPIRQAIDFESAMADVRKVVSFDVGKEAEQLSALATNITKLSEAIPITKEGLAAITAAGGQLGVAREDLADFTTTVAKMSTAFDMLPEEAGDAMAKLANIYQIPIAEMGRLGDAINHLSDNSAAKARDIVPVLQRIGGNARQFGLSAEQASALASSFIALGKPPQVAATAINAMLLKLQAASSQGNKFQDALAELGLSAEELEYSIGEDAQGTLSGFMEQLAQLDKQTRATTLADLFGLEYADDISLLAGSLDQYRDALTLTAQETSYAGSMEREFQTRAATTQNKIQLMQNRWAALQQKIGDKLLPTLNSLMGALEKVIDAVGGWIDKAPGFARVMAMLIGGVGGLALVAAPVVTTFAALISAIALLQMRSAKAAASIAASSATIGAAGKGGMMANALGGGKKWLKGAGLLGVGLGALSIGSTLLDGEKSGTEKAQEVTRDVGGIGGAVAGAAAGAALGSVVPLVGTTVGGIAGGLIGGFGGGWLGDKLASFWDEDDANAEDGKSPLRSPEMKLPHFDGDKLVQAAVPDIAILDGDVPSGKGFWSGPFAERSGMQQPVIDLPLREAEQILSSTTNNSQSQQVYHQPTYNLSITQQLGEDAQSLAERVMQLIEQEQERKQWGALADVH